MNQTEREEIDNKERKFYFWIGKCISKYQSTEDCLENVFTAAMETPEELSKAIFATAQGLERKMELISAAVSNLHQERQQEWLALRARVSKAAGSRNQIAHGGTVFGGQVVNIFMNQGSDKRPEVEVTGESRFWLQKTTKRGEMTWEVDELRIGFLEFELLFRNLIVFIHLLKGDTPPEHLMKDFPKSV